LLQRISIVTLGCKVNYTDSQEISDRLTEQGYAVQHGLSQSDLVIVNGCTVTSKADYQSRQTIRRINKELPGVPVIVTGCGAAVHPDKMADAGDVVSVISGSDVDNICEAVSSQIGTPHEIEQVHSFNGRTRAFLKIQEGCNSFCTYCIVPMARGRERSIATDEVILKIDRLVDSGHKEIVLVGINLGKYGANAIAKSAAKSNITKKSDSCNLANLLELIVKMNPPVRIRISSIEPMDLSPELISVISESDIFTPHLHVPLQSGDDSILKAMGRPYSSDFFVDRVNEAVSKIYRNKHFGGNDTNGSGVKPALGIDVMVGFPGEGDAQFENTVKVLNEIPATYFHVFPYSPRPNTPASKMKDQVNGDVKRERAKCLRDLDFKVRLDYLEYNLGRELVVLGEKYEDSILSGKSENYLTVYYPGVPDDINCLCNVKILRKMNDGLFGNRIG
jgi:threonylcarbamoyladenosine tRNA methylthiotransferase MtaB